MIAFINITDAEMMSLLKTWNLMCQGLNKYFDEMLQQ